jgi:hypothetical protein
VVDFDRFHAAQRRRESKENAAMATQRLDVDPLLAASSFRAASQTQVASYAGPFGSGQAIASRELRTQAERNLEGVVNRRLLGKGIGWAFGIEGVTALCLYAIWFVWHFRP